MPTPVHARLRVGGLLYGDALWSIGLNVADNNGGDPFSVGTTDVQGTLEAWADAVKGLYSGAIVSGAMQTLLSQAGDIRTIRCSRIGDDGKESAVALITLNPVGVGNGSPSQSVQTALVASLGTGRPGSSYRGRMYLPALRATLIGGRVATPAPGDVATDVADWIHQAGSAFRAGVGGVVTGHPVVVSTRRAVATPITTVRVGNLLDSQRRRRGGEQEAYSSATVTQ